MSKANTFKSDADASAAKLFTLNDLKPAPGSKRPKLRVGRGRASGAGKTCNRGHNGEGQRSGRSAKRGFEGGQMPGYRKVPKVRRPRFVTGLKWLELNVGDLAELLLPGETELTYAVLVQRGVLKQTMDGVRILGNGEIDKAITIEAHHVTRGAQAKLEAAGATIKILTETPDALRRTAVVTVA